MQTVDTIILYINKAAVFLLPKAIIRSFNQMFQKSKVKYFDFNIIIFT